MKNIKVVLRTEDGYSDSFDSNTNTLYIHFNSFQETMKKMNKYKKCFIQSEEKEDEDGMTIGFVKVKYDFSSCNFVVDRIEINKLNSDSISLLKSYAKEVNSVYLYGLNLNDICSLYSMVEFRPDTLFFTKYNYQDMSTRDEIMDAVEYIHNIRDYVFQFDLSPLEQAIFVYDLLREREYKFSREDLKIKDGSLDILDFFDKDLHDFPGAKSRSLMKVVKNNSIVCVGFSNVYRAVLESLGIKCEQSLYGAKEGYDTGHASCVAVINDPKYDLCIPVEIDVTSNRMETESGRYSYKKSLLKYGLFARSVFGRFNSIDSSEDMCVESGGDFQHLYIRYKRLENMIDMEAPETILSHAVNLVVSSLVTIGKKYNIPFMLEGAKKLANLDKYTDDEVKSALKPIMDQLLIPIPPKTFYFALTNVKNLEKQINYRKYPSSRDDILKAYSSRFPREYISEILLLECIFGSYDDKTNPYLTDYDYVKDLRVSHNPFMSLKK